MLDFLQSMSNAAADTVASPVDLIAAILKKAGVDVGTPVGGSDWMTQKGLKRPVQQSAESLAGETAGLLSPVVAAAKAPQIAGGLLKMGENAAAPRTLNPQTGAIVWHGSPHKFDKFDSSKIGTGEGAQAYGHGLYLAESPDVARSYISAGGARPTATPEAYAADIVSMMGGEKKALQHLRDILPPAGETTFSGDSRELIAGAIKAVESGAYRQRAGSLYKVDLPDSAIARMLDWDKPLSQQAPEVRDAVANVMEKRAAAAEAQRLAMNAQHPARTTHPVLSKIANKPRSAFDYKGEAAVTELVKELGGPDKAAQFFRSQGIPGIRYLDGGSRGAGSGTSNFVVFPGEENILTILERNGIRVGN